MVLAHAGDTIGEITKWHAHPDVWALVVLVAGGYWFAIKRIGPRFAPAGTSPVTRNRQNSRRW